MEKSKLNFYKTFIMDKECCKFCLGGISSLELITHGFLTDIPGENENGLKTIKHRPPKHWPSKKQGSEYIAINHNSRVI